MALSLNACRREFTPGTLSSSLSPPSCSPAISSAIKCQSFSSSNLTPLQRGARQRVSVKQRRFSILCAATPDLAAGAGKSIVPLIIRDAQITAEPPQDKKVKVRVDMDAQATKRAFDTVLKDLAKSAPPVPGFRKAKGGKTSIVPLSVMYQFLGPKLVRKFVIDEIIKATLQDYVQKEGLKVKNELKTDQSNEELDACFEPGKVFGFDATLNLADEQTGNTEAAVSVDENETVTQAEPLEASV